MIEMIPLKIYFLVPTIVVITIVSLKSYFLNMGWVDRLNHRKSHIGEVPLTGGVAIFAGFVVGVLFVWPEYLYIQELLFLSFVVLLIGFIDDINDSSVFLRLVFQIILGIIIVSYTEIQITSFGNLMGFGEILLGRSSYLVTILSIIAGMNSLNMMDGKDGLASGLSLVAFSFILFLAYSNNAIGYTQLLLIYILAIIPFFIINLSKSKVFMGDSGSLFLGFGLSLLLINSSQGADAFIKPVTVLWIIALPLIDIVSVIVLRLLSGNSPLLADRRHLHHQIGEIFGFSDKTVTLLLIVFAFLIALIGIILDRNNVPEWIMFFGFMSIFFSYMVIALLRRDNSI